MPAICEVPYEGLFTIEASRGTMDAQKRALSLQLGRWEGSWEDVCCAGPSCDLRICLQDHPSEHHGRSASHVSESAATRPTFLETSTVNTGQCKASQ